MQSKEEEGISWGETVATSHGKNVLALQAKDAVRNSVDPSLVSIL